MNIKKKKTIVNVPKRKSLETPVTESFGLQSAAALGKERFKQFLEDRR